MKNANLLLYLNLAGEVFYIIVHRMKSQKVKEEHQERVRNDIAVAICHTTVIQNLLKGSLQILNLKLTDVRILMDRIVHSSIMTVNAFSMEKLFELTLIATKYQYTTCQYPSDILLIGLNHLDTIRKTVTDSTAKTLAENLHNLLVDRFKDEQVQTMQTYRYLILSYLADVKLKMTNLIRLGLQKTTGDFAKQLPDNVKRQELNQPGLIEVFNTPDEDETQDIKCINDCHFSCECDGFDTQDTIQTLTSAFQKRPVQIHESAFKGSEVQTTRFLTERYGLQPYPILKPSLALNGSRMIELGLSIYDIPGNCDDAIGHISDPVDENNGKIKSGDGGSGQNPSFFVNDKNYYSSNPCADAYATKGLDLCSVLLGCEGNESTVASETNTSKLPISASALGLESVLGHFPSISLNAHGAASNSHDPNMDSNSTNSINVIKLDGRSDTSGSKAALVAIAQDFFDLEAADEKENSSRSTIDDLFDDGFQFSDDLV